MKSEFEVIDEMHNIINKKDEDGKLYTLPSKTKLKLNSNWAKFNNKVEQREDGYWYVKGDTQNIPFFGYYDNSDDEGIRLNQKEKCFEFNIHRFFPVLLHEHLNTYSAPYSNPNCYKYVREYTEEEKMEIEERFKRLGIKPTTLMNSKWTDEAPKNEDVKEMWDLAWKEKCEARFAREAIEAKAKEKELAELPPKENVEHKPWYLD